MNWRSRVCIRYFVLFLMLQGWVSLFLHVSGGDSLAAVFFPEPVELEAARKQDGVSAFELDKVLSKAEPGVDYVQIDDMRFKKDDLIRYDGFTGTRWTNGVVYYAFDASVNTTNRQRWRAAAATWSAVAGLTFIERTTQPNYIYVKDDPGNWSWVGMISGRQEMGIYNWTFKFIIAHEIGHALGLDHEHSRANRDSYVTILWANITPGVESNFYKSATTSYNLYDFDSVMHYSKNSFTRNSLNTIEPLPTYNSWLNLIGQRDHLSTRDKSSMTARYPSAPPGTEAPALNFLSLLLSDESCVIPNGDFEGGRVSWLESASHVYPLIGQWGSAHRGTWYAWLAGSRNQNTSISINVRVPSSCPLLVFAHRIASAESLCIYDFGYVKVNGATVRQYNLCTTTSTGGWMSNIVDLSGYKNQSVTIEFRADQDASVISSWYIDDVFFMSEGGGIILSPR